ncbi:TolC family protein [Alginatibacterium sediminis]|uniref:TolC family protein n=2 Tax=Alginatibacterium sediminis TaxID=2164068 RepID=A0A420E5I4_9ALTE|nr:TolC family protein [Alginatibacterium sediminis]
MDFEQAWHTLLQSSDKLAANQANVDRSDALAKAALSLYYPKVDLQGSYTRLQKPVALDLKDLEPIASNPDLLHGLAGFGLDLSSINTVTNFTEQDVTTSSIQALWPIFTGGKREAAIDIAREQGESAKHLWQMERQVQFESLAKTYFAVVLAKQVVDVNQQVVDGLQAHYENALKLQQQGQIAYVELLQAQASFDKAKVDQKKSQRNYEITQLALNDLIHQNGVHPTTPLFTQEQFGQLHDYEHKTLEAYPGLALLDSKQYQAKRVIDIEKAAYMPTVAAFGNYNVYKGDSLAAKVTPDWAVGVGISIPLIDNSGRSEKVQAAHSLELQVRHLKSQAKRDLGLLVEKTFREASQALEEYNGLKSSVTLAEENLRMRQKAFSQGLATSVDVVDAQMFKASVNIQRQAAAYQHVVALAKLSAISSQVEQFSQFYRNASLVQPPQS